MPDLVVAGACGERNFSGHLRPQARAGVVRVDLGGLTFCEPLGLVAVAALVDRATDAGEVVFTSPRRPSVARYLSRMRLGRVLTDLGVDHDLPTVREHRQDGVLVELTAFTDSGDVDRLAAMVHDTLEPTDQGAAGILYSGLAEAGDNVPRHARRRNGFLAAQKVGPARNLLFAVADGGVGMFGTLKGRGARDASHALDLAVVQGVTERPDQDSVTGLHAVAAELIRCGGYLHVLSDDAHLTVGRFTTRGTAWQAFDGTAVQGLVRSAAAP